MKKKIIYVILLVAESLLAGCNRSDVTGSQDDAVNGMKCPVILMAKSPETNDKYSSVILVDGDGELHSFSGIEQFAAAIASTCDVGDTIKPCKE